MSASFFHHYLDFFLSFIVIMFGSLTTMACVILFFIVHNSWFLTGFSGASMATLFYTLNFLTKFRAFEGNLELYFPRITKNEQEAEYQTEINRIVAEKTDLPLKACELFVQNSSYGDIETKLGLSHPQQAKRVLQKGIKNLLEKNGEKNA